MAIPISLSAKKSLTAALGEAKLVQGPQGVQGEKGEKGDTGNGISSAALGDDYTLTLTFTDGSQYTTPSIRGATGATGAKGDKGDTGSEGVQGEKGDKGDTGNGISGAALGDDYTLTLTFTDGSQYTTPSIRGATGATGAKGDKGDTGPAGNGVESVALTGGNHAAGTLDTYTMTFTDGTWVAFNVYNGADGEGSGDMLKSVYDPSGKNADIFGYVDEAIESIPTPDVSGQIEAHNTAASAHSSLLAAKADASALTSHAGDTTAHVTAAERSAWNAKQAALTFDTAPTAGSSNPVTSGGIRTALDAKQGTLTFDTAPTADSSNPVTSSGIKSYVDSAVGEAAEKANIATGSYVGTGTYNSSYPCSLTFDFVPKVIIINPMVGSSGGGTSRLNPITYPVEYIYGIAYQTGSSYQEAFRVSVSYSGTTVNWYSTESAAKQQNESNRTYYYVAIG